MKIIAIEGLDKSGKHTQSELLKQKFETEGYRVVKSEFHRYDTPTGQLIMKWLKKEWDVDQKTIELIMAADKQAQQLWFQQLDDEGIDFLILDRYTLSQEVYARANDIDSFWTNALQKYMRQPDVEFLIDIPVDVSMQRKGKYNNGLNDRYESDKQLLEKVREIYLSEAKKINRAVWKEGYVQIISGLQTIEEIHEEIWSFLKAKVIN